jgi:hypothetical protein
MHHIPRTSFRVSRLATPKPSTSTRSRPGSRLHLRDRRPRLSN